VGTKREGPRQSPSSQAVDPRALDAALRLFVSAFVVEDKRAQIHKRLLAGERRLETLASLPRWLTGGASLEGADRSPAGLRARFGDLVGIVLTEEGARRAAIAHALELGRGTSSVFIADNGNVAMITSPGQSPLLCSRFGRS
jgi:hypothetical protein